MLFFISVVLQASIVHQIDDAFFEDDFEQIIRFDRLHFNDEGFLDAKSLKTVQDAVKKIKEIQKTSKVKVTLVGHMYKADDYYPKKIKNSLSYIDDINKSTNESIAYVQKLEKYLVEKGIDSTIISLYAKRGKVLSFSDETLESGELSNRVMLSIYVLKETKAFH